MSLKIKIRLETGYDTAYKEVPKGVTILAYSKEDNHNRDIYIEVNRETLAEAIKAFDKEVFGVGR